MSRNSGNWNKTPNSNRISSTRIIPRQRPTIQHPSHSPCILNNLLLCNTSIHRRLWQLLNPANTRRTRHSIPTTKQHKILTPTPIPNSPSIIRSSRKRSRYRMNSISTPSKKSRTLRPISRPGNFLPSFSRSILNPRCYQLHHHNNQHTLKRTST